MHEGTCGTRGSRFNAPESHETATTGVCTTGGGGAGGMLGGISFPKSRLVQNRGM